MKRWFVLLSFCMAAQVYAQLGSLVGKGFNDAYPVMDTTYEGYMHRQDSAGLWKAMGELEAQAREKGDADLEFLAALTRVRYEARHNRNADYIDSLYQSLIDKAVRRKNPKIAALLEFNLAGYYWLTVENYELALEHYLSNYQYLQQVKDEEFRLKQGEIYTLGEKYFVFTDYANARIYLHKALQVKNPFDSSFSISIYNTLGMSFNAQEQLDSAEYYFRQALSRAELLHAGNWIGNLCGNIGGIYYKQGKREEAMRWIRKDIDESIRNHAPGPTAGAYLLAATINFDLGNPELAVKQIDSCLQYMGTNRPPHRLKVLYPLQAKRYAYLGEWKLAAAYIDSSLAVRDSLAAKTSAVHLMRVQQKTDLEQHRAEIGKVESERRIRTLQRNVMLGILGLALVGGALLYRQKRRTDQARKRSDELLLNILPSDVAAELKANGEAKARRFSDVTVLFSDFKDFTMHSEAMGPEELVQRLDNYFKAFDEIIGKYGLEKIKTVGDAYICACGLPNADPQHAQKVIRAALEMQQYMRNHADGWQLRIGVHSGPVVAGIVGIKKFAYDIWGDTVNTAARMEQNSQAGQINISKVTYELIKHDFPCAYRGLLDVKNKGAMDMYFVLQ